MIHRYGVLCPGCDQKIILRLSIGIDEEQSFYFICNNCGIPTEGKQVISYEPTPSAKIIFDDVVSIDDIEGDQTINIHPDLPSIATASEMSQEGGSPFLTLNVEFGQKGFEDYIIRSKGFQGILDYNWVKYDRAATYYKDNNLEQLKLQLEKIYEQKTEVLLEDKYIHELMHNGLLLIFDKLLVHPYYKNLQDEFFDILKRTISPNGTFKDFITANLDENEIVTLQTKIYDCIRLFVKYKSSILPGLALEFYDKYNSKLTDDLRLFKNDFSELRDLYINTSEAVHKVLYYIIAINNIHKRNNCDDFGSIIPPKILAINQRFRDVPNNFRKFNRLSNAFKRGYLHELPEWDNSWENFLDRELRNKIGHHSVRHDLKTGTLISDENISIPYTEFIVKTFRLLYPLLAASFVLTNLRIGIDEFKSQ